MALRLRAQYEYTTSNDTSITQRSAPTKYLLRWFSTRQSARVSSRGCWCRCLRRSWTLHSGVLILRSQGWWCHQSRAELLALIIALLVAGEGDNVFSDSKYCVRGFNEWLDSWKRNAWRNSSKKPVANQDLWMLIDELKAIRPRVSVEHVAGHSGIKGNEHSDRLARQAAEGKM